MSALRVFRQRGFPLLFTGLLASMAGDSLMLLMLAVWVKDLTGSSGAAGLTFLFLALPAFLAPALGLFVDRLRRRTVLIWGNAVSALAVSPLLFVHDRDDVWIIYTVAFLYGVSFVVLPAALNGLLKEMLPEHMLVDANASLATSKEALRLVGPLAGAGLYSAIGGAGVAAVDAASFVIAALVVVMLKVREDAPEREEQHWRDELLAGVRHIRRDRVLFHTIAAVSIALLVVGFMESAVFAMIDAFDKDATFVGVIVSVQGVGAIAGGVLSSRIVRAVGEPQAIGVGIVAVSSGLLVAAAAPNLAVVFAGVICLGFGLPVFVVAFTTILQVRTPQALMGRVTTAVDVLFGTPQALSLAGGALLVGFLSFRTIYVITAVVMMVAAVYLRLVLGRIDVSGGAQAAAPAGSPAGLPGVATELELSEPVGGAGAEVGEDLSEVEPG